MRGVERIGEEEIGEEDGRAEERGWMEGSE